MKALNLDEVGRARKLYISVRRQAIEASPDVSIQKFDGWVRSSLPVEPTPMDWCKKALELFTLIKAKADEDHRTAMRDIGDYFGQAGSTR